MTIVCLMRNTLIAAASLAGVPAPQSLAVENHRRLRKSAAICSGVCELSYTATNLPYGPIRQTTLE